ncbi:glycosyltransferase [Streptomyces sp. NPDC001339]|uniref:glycosyltransferase n=1 Tax=Streptomyces sp. NPDC001339 TaxID=3364563 RepID=UPI0036C3873C
MEQRHGPILFVSIADAGLINPLLEVAGELSRRGVPDLWFASTEDRRADVEAIKGRTPVGFVSLGDRLEKPPAVWDAATYARATQPPRRGSPTSRAANVVHYLREVADSDILETMYRRTLAEVDKLQPALMVVDSSSVYPADAAIARKVPYVLSVPVSVSEVFADRLPWSHPTPNSGLPSRMTLRQKAANVSFRLRVIAGILKNVPHAEFARSRKEAGIENVTAAQSFYGDQAAAIVAYSVFGMEYPFPAVPPTLKMVGPAVPPLPQAPDGDHELTSWLDANDSVVYIAFGTHMRLTRSQLAMMTDAVGRIGPRHKVLWKLPEHQQALLPAQRPDNLRLETWVPSQLDVLAHPHVRVYFNHGGGNSAYEGVYFGKPGLVMPFWMDCYDHAARVVESGAGLRVECSLRTTADEVAGKLVRLLEEDGFRERAQYWAQRYREAGGVAAAADTVQEQYAALARA